jgi:hypothetical protein
MVAPVVNCPPLPPPIAVSVPNKELTPLVFAGPPEPTVTGMVAPDVTA